MKLTQLGGGLGRDGRDDSPGDGVGRLGVSRSDGGDGGTAGNGPLLHDIAVETGPVASAPAPAPARAPAPVGPAVLSNAPRRLRRGDGVVVEVGLGRLVVAAGGGGGGRGPVAGLLAVRQRAEDGRRPSHGLPLLEVRHGPCAAVAVAAVGCDGLGYDDQGLGLDDGSLDGCRCVRVSNGSRFGLVFLSRLTLGSRCASDSDDDGGSSL